MVSAQVITDGAGNKELAERNYYWQDEHKEARGSIVGEGHGLSEEDESRINEVAEDMNDHHELAVRAEAGLQKQQLAVLPQPQQQQNLVGHVVQWEKFLPLRSLKVLLVENDDSTRQVVSALLRNCSYEVTTAANGLQAWKILEDLTNHIDLVLTEIVMPYLNGIGLLCKIMNHKTCKNIPVIMMSSHDSMGIVFSCLSKGAVDFLVKPIRKNELKNLWQHIWRRCHSSSGSGSESGIHTQKSAKLKSGDESDNKTGSNDEDDNGSIGLNGRDGSDNGSGTQSSWKKRAVEVDSPQPMLPWDQFADPHDSTCAQVIHPKSETFCNEWMPMTRECQEQKEHFLDNVEMGKDLEIGVTRNPDFHLESYTKEVVSSNLTGTKQDKLSQQDGKKIKKPDEGLLKVKSNNPFIELRAQAADLIDAIANSVTSAPMEIRVTEAPNCISKISETEGNATPDPDTKELPSLELSLKRLRSVGDVSTTDDNRNVLRHSDLSAFSRYNISTAATKTPTGLGGSNSLPLDNSSAVKMESMYNMPSNSNANPLNRGSNESSNNNDMGSTTNNAFTKPMALKEKSATKCVHPTSAFQPVQQCRAGPPKQSITEKVVDVAVAAVGQPRGTHRQVQVQHHHCHYHHHHHHHHHLHNMQQQQLTPDHDDLSVKSLAAAAPQDGSSNGFGGPMEGNDGNYSLNGSASGSNHGSNGQNGSSIAVNTEGLNMESDNGVAGKNLASVGSGSGSGVDQNRVAQRVAALTKFRQKRKERCFEKKTVMDIQSARFLVWLMQVEVHRWFLELINVLNLH